MLQLLDFLRDLRQRTFEVGPVEADGRRAPLHLARVEQRGQGLRHVVEDALALFLLHLQALPALAHSASASDVGFAEHVRVTPNELVDDRARRRFEIPTSFFLERQRQEKALEEQVAELVEQLRVVGGECGVGDLVGLLDRVRDDRLRRLLAVPGAVATEAASERIELGQRLGEAQPTGEVGKSAVWPGLVADDGAYPSA